MGIACDERASDEARSWSLSTFVRLVFPWAFFEATAPHAQRRDHSVAPKIQQFGKCQAVGMMDHMTGRSVLICVALKMEGRAIARKMGATFDANRMRVTQVLGDIAIDIVVIGVSACRLPKELDVSKYDVVISAGLAGALSPKLRCGEVVVDGYLARWPEEVKRGRILHADAIIASPKRKQELFDESGA